MTEKIDKLYKRALKLSKDSSYFVYLDFEAKIYIEIKINRVVQFVGGNSGIGKTYLIKRIKDLKINRITTPEISSYSIDKVWAVGNSSELYKDIPKETKLVLVDRLDIMKKEEQEQLNRCIEKVGCYILFGRTGKYINSRRFLYYTNLKPPRLMVYSVL